MKDWIGVQAGQQHLHERDRQPRSCDPQLDSVNWLSALVYGRHASELYASIWLDSSRLPRSSCRCTRGHAPGKRGFNVCSGGRAKLPRDGPWGTNMYCCNCQ